MSNAYEELWLLREEVRNAWGYFVKIGGAASKSAQTGKKLQQSSFRWS